LDDALDFGTGLGLDDVLDFGTGFLDDSVIPANSAIS
jgi:hypothetical protein